MDQTVAAMLDALRDHERRISSLEVRIGHVSPHKSGTDNSKLVAVLTSAVFIKMALGLLLLAAGMSLQDVVVHLK